MSELSPVLLALALGMILGAMFFASLWWTVARGTSSRHAAAWFLLSLLLRTSVAVLGFYLIGRGSWQKLAACLAGFVIARFIVIRLSAAATLRPQSAARASHAP